MEGVVGNKVVELFVGLGSNLALPVEQIRRALCELQAMPKSQFIKASKLYRTTPLGPSDQPDFINAVAKLTTTLSPHAVLHHLQQIENHHGRQRSLRWGPRTLDLDILLYGVESINTPNLIVPHVGLKQREFVLYPLLEIAPDLILPSGETISQLVLSCQRPLPVPIDG